MDPREYELIALGHVLARYRIQGELPNIEGKPFDLNEFKSRLFTGVPTGTNTDVDVAIIQNTIVNEDDQCDNKNEPTTAPVNDGATEQSPVVESTVEEKPIEETSAENTNVPVSTNPFLGGKLFDFFNKDKK